MRIRHGVIVLGVAALTGAAAMVGCGDDGSANPGPGGGGGSGTGDCSLTNPVCKAVDSECIAVHDNRDKTRFGLRMAQLTITKPDVLASGFIAKLVADSLTMNLRQCYLNGTGDFSWLLEIDKTAGTLRTGGALFAKDDDPLQGYCFANTTVDDFEITPVEVDAALTDGAFDAEIEGVNVPIFVGTSDKPIVLPLHGVRLSDVRLSADNNCIGQRNSELDWNNQCLPDEEHPAFINGGKLSGYILLEEVDKVIVDLPLKGKSLCLVLAESLDDGGDYASGADPDTCKRDENDQIIVKGDWCSSTNSPATADCADAFALGGEFAASAVEITGLCQQ